MAIERSSSISSTGAVATVAAERLVYLWSYRWLILAVGFFVALLTYLAMWFVPEEFEAKTAVYVDRMEIFDIRPISPMTVAGLAKNPELLRRVYDEYTAKFGNKPGDFEKFVKQFEVASETLQDTTVKKEFSPVLELKVRFRGREQTRFLAESWVRNLVTKFGNVSLEEAQKRADAMGKRDRQLDAELAALDKERAELDSQIVGRRKLLAETLDVLAPAEWPEAPLDAMNARNTPNAANVLVSVNQPPPKPEGLWSRYLRLQFELERARVGLPLATTATAELLAKEESVLSSTILQLEARIRQLETLLAQTQQRLSTVSRLYDEKQAERQRLRSALDVYRSVAAAYFEWDGKGLPTAGDLRALSAPVMPDVRVWPKRTLVAAGAAFTAVLLTIAILLVRHMIAGASPSRRLA
ncbi:MAG: hypothetical protein ACPL7D_04835 [Candidatus Sumerlaeaceae bacterium]